VCAYCALLATPFASRTVARVLEHPIHTTLTQLTYDAAGRHVNVAVRAFADDFGTAMARRLHAAAPPDDQAYDAASYAYITAVLALADRGGRALPFEWCGSRRSGGVVWLCLRAQAPQGLGGIRVMNRCLFELFDDQINIVQAQYGDRRITLLFTKDDAARVLPP
jgi:hypothetical protein